MAWKKRNYKRKVYRKGGGRSANAKANKALAMVRALRKNVEYKSYEDDIINTTTLSNAGVVYPLVDGNTFGGGILQGVNEDERIGDSIRIKNLTIRFSVQRNTGATFQSVRMIFFRGKSDDGVTYTTGDILAINDILAPKKDSERYNTKILFDRTFVLDAGQKSLHLGRQIIKVDDYCNFLTASSTVTNGGLYCLLMQNGNTLSPGVQILYRITYTDA